MKLPTLALLLTTAQALESEAAEGERRLGANDGICGPDDRTPASYKAVGAFYHGSDQGCKCTAFLISEDIFLTSSGCIQGGGNFVEGCGVDDESVIHFNDRSHFASVDRQFEVDLDSFKSYSTDGQGQAWAAGRLKKTNGKTAGVTVGSWFDLGFVPPVEVKAPVRVPHYGSGTKRQMSGVGNMEDKYVPGFDLVYFQADAGDGYGAPVIDTDQGKVVGIYTKGQCATGGSNLATPSDSNSLNEYIRCLKAADPLPGDKSSWKDQYNGKGCDWVAENPVPRCRRYDGPRGDPNRRRAKAACIKACCGVRLRGEPT